VPRQRIEVVWVSRGVRWSDDGELVGALLAGPDLSVDLWTGYIGGAYTPLRHDEFVRLAARVRARPTAGILTPMARLSVDMLSEGRAWTWEEFVGRMPAE